MGAGCYKEKPLTVSRDAVLKAVNDRYVNDTILTEAINNNEIEPSKAEANKNQ